MTVMMIGAALLLLMAMGIDRVCGEPRAAFHPVVWMGHYLKACGHLATACRPAPAFLLGAVFWCSGATVVCGLAWGLQVLALEPLFGHTGVLKGGRPDALIFAGLLLSFVTCAWLLKCMFSWRMLRDESRAVEVALQQSLPAGRTRLAMLVSRDTSSLSADEVRESAIESLAENFNDSVVAPIFWFVVFGLPGAAVYRFANTADAMWGYRGFRHGVYWEWAGKWAAWADDVLSWLPARITATLFWLLSAARPAFSAIRAEARKTPSPNSGWPMAAMALLLDLRLGKPGVYVLNPQGRLPAETDANRADSLASRVFAAIAWTVFFWALLLVRWTFFQ